MARIKKLNPKSVDEAIDSIANYYRDSRLYLYESNSDDAYEFFKKTYGDDLKVLISQGYSYEYKDNYLIACDVISFKKEHPKEFEHFFGVVPDIYVVLQREVKPSLFICAFGPTGNYITNDGYTLIEGFVSMYGNHVILTDCAAGGDIRCFESNTSSRRITIGGREAWRWA